METMEADERPSKMRKLSHDAIEIEQPTVQLSSELEPEPDLSKEDKRGSRKGEQSDNQTDADSAESSDDGADIKAEKLPRPLGMSKNAWKKLQKKADWEAGREYRKIKRKEKIQEKKARKRAAKIEARVEDAPQPTANGSTTKDRTRKHIKLPITFLIDCGFDNLMMEKERISLGSQLTRAYSDNNRAPFQAHMVVSSWGGLLKERFDTVLAKHHENWKDVVFTDKDFLEAAEIAKDAMKGRLGGELGGIFSRYGSRDQPEIESAKDSVQHHHSSNENKEISDPKDIYSGKPDALLPTDIEPSIAAISQPLSPVQLEDVEPEARQDCPPSSARAPPTAILEHSVASQQGVHACHTTNNTAPANGQLQSSISEHIPPEGSTPDLEQGEVVYLTSDSPYTLDKLKPYSVYIIGGLVDKNRHKGICYKTACERGLKTAKLPIGEFMEMQSRFVLATNHVIEIMVRWLECGDWGKAFLDVIPKRKGGKLKGSDATPESAGLDNEEVEERAEKEDTGSEEASDHL